MFNNFFIEEILNNTLTDIVLIIVCDYNNRFTNHCLLLCVRIKTTVMLINIKFESTLDKERIQFRREYDIDSYGIYSAIGLKVNG